MNKMMIVTTGLLTTMLCVPALSRADTVCNDYIDEQTVNWSDWGTASSCTCDEFGVAGYANIDGSYPWATVINSGSAGTVWLFLDGMGYAQRNTDGTYIFASSANWAGGELRTWDPNNTWTGKYWAICAI